MLELFLWFAYFCLGSIAFVATIIYIKIKDYNESHFNQIDPTGTGGITILLAMVAFLVWPTIPLVIGVYFLNKQIDKLVKMYIEFTNKDKKQ